MILALIRCHLDVQTALGMPKLRIQSKMGSLKVLHIAIAATGNPTLRSYSDKSLLAALWA